MPFLKAEDIIPAEMLQDPILVGLENDQYFLESVLRASEGDVDLDVISAEATPCCKAGDNYMSSMTRVTVIGRNRAGESFKRCVIMKRQPANFARRQAFRCDPAFRNETHSYESIVPTMAEFAGTSMPFPECLLASSQLVVLQDLQPLGFKMADRLKGLDLVHAELAITALAKFHGTSLAMKHVVREKFDAIRSLTTELAFAPESEPMFGASVENALKMALAALENVKSKGVDSWATSWELDDAVHKMHKLQGSVFKRLRALTRPTEPLAVLCHGDLWLNNMLFRYEGEEPVEVKFVDLQVMRYSSLVTDILYFLTTSVEPSVLRFHHDDLIGVYHEALVSYVAKLAPSAPRITLDQINDQIEELALFGLFMGFLLLPAITNETEIDLDQYFTDKNVVECSDIQQKFESQHQMMMTEKYQERVRNLVLHYVDRGFI